MEQDINELDYISEDEDENGKKIQDEELIQINDYDEKNARNELLNYLNDEEKNIDMERQNILKKYTKDSIQGSNSFTKISDNKFEDQKTDLSKHFKGGQNEKYSVNILSDKSSNNKFNTEGFTVSSGANKKLFGNVEAFDDFDDAYASFDK